MREERVDDGYGGLKHHPSLRRHSSDRLLRHATTITLTAAGHPSSSSSSSSRSRSIRPKRKGNSISSSFHRAIDACLSRLQGGPAPASKHSESKHKKSPKDYKITSNWPPISLLAFKAKREAIKRNVIVVVRLTPPSQIMLFAIFSETT